MNTFLILAAIIATSLARPQNLLGDNDGHVSVSQSTAGTYKYTVQLKDSLRSEERFPDGTVLGAYTIIDANGVPRTIKYSAGIGGFIILEGLEGFDALAPVAPVEPIAPVVVKPIAPIAAVEPIAPVAPWVDDTVEVVAARHGLIVPSHGSSQTFTSTRQDVPLAVPQVPEYTPEVLAAREEFFALHRAAAARTA